MVRSTAKTKKGFRDRGRFRRRLRELRQQRELALRDLGGLIFELHRFKQSRQDLVDKKLATLNEIDQELRGLENTLQAFRVVEELHEPGVSSCPSCGALHGTSANFCPTCGLSLKGARAIDSVQHGSEFTPQQAAKQKLNKEPSQIQASPLKDSDTKIPVQPETTEQAKAPTAANQHFTPLGTTQKSEEYAVPKLTSMETLGTQQNTAAEKANGETLQPPATQVPSDLTQKSVPIEPTDQQQQNSKTEPNTGTNSGPSTTEPAQSSTVSPEKNQNTSNFQPTSQHLDDHHKDEVPTVSSGDPLAG